jgi:Tfp pilus assembly protein PilE
MTLIELVLIVVIAVGAAIACSSRVRSALKKLRDKAKGGGSGDDGGGR